jgi:NAD(P)-dependent dehydrogenase (short-subunit alcohol dehydrogenase family)
MNEKKVILITGASSGIGQACAERLAQHGQAVYGTSRHASPDGARQPAGHTLLQLDVTDDASVARCVGQVMEREGRLDAVVNCAAHLLAGAVEDTQVAEARVSFETNFFGTMRVCGAALPIMRRQGSGHLVIFSSIAALISVPFQAFYCASKNALEDYAESLRGEVRPFGIRVVLIEPGDYRTGNTANRERTKASQGQTPYAAACARAVKVMETDERHAETPEPVAVLVERILATPSPRLRHMSGPFVEQLAVQLKKVLPESLFEWGIGKYYQVR